VVSDQQQQPPRQKECPPRRAPGGAAIQITTGYKSKIEYFVRFSHFLQLKKRAFEKISAPGRASPRRSLSAAIRCSMALLAISLISLISFAFSCEVIWFLQPTTGTKAPCTQGNAAMTGLERLKRMATGVTGRGSPGATVC